MCTYIPLLTGTAVGKQQPLAEQPTQQKQRNAGRALPLTTESRAEIEVDRRLQ